MIGDPFLLGTSSMETRIYGTDFHDVYNFYSPEEEYDYIFKKQRYKIRRKSDLRRIRKGKEPKHFTREELLGKPKTSFTQKQFEPVKLDIGKPIKLGDFKKKIKTSLPSNQQEAVVDTPDTTDNGGTPTKVAGIGSIIGWVLVGGLVLYGIGQVIKLKPKTAAEAASIKPQN